MKRTCQTCGSRYRLDATTPDRPVPTCPACEPHVAEPAPQTAKKSKKKATGGTKQHWGPVKVFAKKSRKKKARTTEQDPNVEDQGQTPAPQPKE